MSALSSNISIADLQVARESNDGHPKTAQFGVLVAYGPQQAQFTYDTQEALLAVRAGGNNVTTNVSQMTLMMAFGTGVPTSAIQAAWSFILDGHRFYVLPLGDEGDWAYDTTTREWCQLQSQGFPGINFSHGIMWGLRVIGGDVLYTYLWELDPSQSLDEGWREVKHMVTGGIATRTRSVIGVANFALTASVGLEGAIDQPVSLAYSDDNGVSWSQEFDLPLTDMGSQVLIWSALGSFAAPGRVFRITDYSGPVRLDGADAVFTAGTGADAAQDSDGQPR